MQCKPEKTSFQLKGCVLSLLHTLIHHQWPENITALPSALSPLCTALACPLVYKQATSTFASLTKGHLTSSATLKPSPPKGQDLTYKPHDAVREKQSQQLCLESTLCRATTRIQCWMELRM
jgi:hypothetical protein